MFTRQSQENYNPNTTLSERSSLLLATDLLDGTNQGYSTHEGKKIRKEFLSQFPHVRSVSSDWYEVYRTQINTDKTDTFYSAENDPESVKIYNKSESPINKLNKTEKVTEPNVEKQKCISKTLEKRKKIKNLVKTLIEARKKEKSKVAWKIYINVLKMKHEGFLERTQSTISCASPSTHLAKVFDDVYNTRLKSDSLNVKNQSQQQLQKDSIENYMLPVNHPNNTIQNFPSTTRHNPYLGTPVTPSSLLNEKKFIWKVKPIDCLPTSAEGRLLQQNALLTSNMAYRLRSCGLIYKTKPVFHKVNTSCVPKNETKIDRKPPNRLYNEYLRTRNTRLPVPRKKMTVLSTTSIKRHKNYKHNQVISRISPNNQNDLNYRFLRTLDYKLDKLIEVLHSNPIEALHQCNVGVESNVDQGPASNTLGRQEKCALHTIMKSDSDTFQKSYSNTMQKSEVKYRTFLREWTRKEEKYERDCYSKDGGDSNDGRSKEEDSHYWDAKEEKGDSEFQLKEGKTAYEWGPNREKDYRYWRSKKREHSRSDKDQDVADWSLNREKDGRDLSSKETDKRQPSEYSPHKLQRKSFTVLPPESNTNFREENGCENLNNIDSVNELSKRLQNNDVDYWQPVSFINNDKSEKYFHFAKQKHGRDTEEIFETKILPEDIEETFTQYESIISARQDVKEKQSRNPCETTQTVLPERKYIIIINQCLSNENYKNEMQRTTNSREEKKDVGLSFDENDLHPSSNQNESTNEKNVHKNIVQEQDEHVLCNCKCNPVCYNPCCSKVVRECSKQIQCCIKISEKICQAPQEGTVQTRCSETILEKICKAIKQPDQIVTNNQENHVPHHNSVHTFTVRTQYSDNKTNLETILLEELNKSNEAKRDINKILGGEKMYNQRSKLDVDLPSKDCCIEVSESFIKANNKTPLSARKITAAVNTDPMGLLTLFSLSRETVGRLLANAQSSCCYYLTLPRIITPRHPVTSYRAKIRNTTATPFQSTVLVEQESDRKSLLGKEQTVAPRDCCVCRHILQRHTNGPPKMSGCRYCGKTFTRANCLNLHEQQCFKIKGKLRL